MIDEEFDPQDGLIGYGWGTEIMITNVADISALSDAKQISLPQGEKGYVASNAMLNAGLFESRKKY